MRRTLLVTNDFPPRAGGIQSYLQNLVDRLPPEDVVVYAPRWKGYADFDARQPYRVYRHRTTLMLPTPLVARRAADIIRRAMIRMPGALEAAGLKTRMLLQVHDELVFEAPEAEAEAAIALVRRVMEGAAEPAATLSVPLVVEARAAANWDEAH